MMEYKFKAWVKPVIEDGEVIYSGCMVDVWGIDFKRRKIIYYEPFDLLPMIGRREEMNFDEVELLLYTGKHDKNGNEVYDGSILRREGCWDVRIEFENGVFWVRDADRTRYVNKILNTPISDFAIEEFELIGNVWDNPELLKEGSV
jgi:hypothetical protein